MSLEWSKEKTEALVSLYQQNQCLYDPSHYLYRDRSERKKTISYIASVLQTSENSITSKIKNIRSQLWREKWKEQYRELSGTEDRGSWWLKDSLQFLQPFLVLKPATCCLPLEDGQALQSAVSPGSEPDKDLMQTSNIDFHHQTNCQHTVNRTDFHSPSLQVSNPTSGQANMEVLHNDEQENDVSGGDSDQFNQLEEIERIKDDTEEASQDNSTDTRNDPTRFISNYPTGIFRNDYLFDGRSQKARYKQIGPRSNQRMAEKCNEPGNIVPEGRSQIIDENINNCFRYVNSDSTSANILTELQLRSKQILSEHPSTSACDGSHPERLSQQTTYPEFSQRIPDAEIAASPKRNIERDSRTLQHTRNQRKRLGNSVRRVVEKYTGKADTTRHKKSKPAEKDTECSCKWSRSNTHDGYDGSSKCSGGHLLVQAVSCLERVSDRLAVEDQCSVFGKHVANELRSVTSLEAQRWARMKIQNILYEAQTFVNPSSSVPRSTVHADISDNRNSSTNNGTVQSTSVD
ncbi:uncharacterized protein LOC117101550 [Anneissia japonica]|uniref:uncharacterized protein LOC117101550 n=1 Tax=Anneissia japonica TaxID=1529436 RepID=UPI0014259287|nr:uncharacterized protein LOC117101550 [Anneissia japonica]